MARPALLPLLWPLLGSLPRFGYNGLEVVYKKGASTTPKLPDKT